jgi:hypothetical protein
MKIKQLSWAALAFVPAAILTLTACKSTPTGETTTTSTIQQGQPGGIVVKTHKTKATVTGIDRDDREVTTVAPDGKKTKFICGPEVRNFDQIRVGDQVKATVTEKVAVSLLDPGLTRTSSQSSVVALSPKGEKPGVVWANVVETIARVEKLDLKKREVTLRFPDGDSETYEVRKDVDMSRARLGQEVSIRSTKAVAVHVETY